MSTAAIVVLQNIRLILGLLAIQLSIFCTLQQRQDMDRHQRGMRYFPPIRKYRRMLGCARFTCRRWREPKTVGAGSKLRDSVVLRFQSWKYSLYIGILSWDCWLITLIHLLHSITNWSYIDTGMTTMYIPLNQPFPKYCIDKSRLVFHDYHIKPPIDYSASGQFMGCQLLVWLVTCS